MSSISFLKEHMYSVGSGRRADIYRTGLKDSSHPLFPNGTQSIKSDRTRKYLQYFYLLDDFISQAYHWPCTFYFCIEPVWVSYNQSQGPSIPSVHSSFHKYYHNSISGHKYQPGIKWRSHLDYACIVHNDYLNTSPMDYWSN